MKYNHAFDLNFEIVSECENASDVTASMLRASITNLFNNLNNLSDKELKKACNHFDTIEAE